MGWLMCRENKLRAGPRQEVVNVFFKKSCKHIIITNQGHNIFFEELRFIWQSILKYEETKRTKIDDMLISLPFNFTMSGDKRAR